MTAGAVAELEVVGGDVAGVERSGPLGGSGGVEEESGGGFAGGAA
jgi:hypothetical protein